LRSVALALLALVLLASPAQAEEFIPGGWSQVFTTGNSPDVINFFVSGSSPVDFNGFDNLPAGWTYSQNTYKAGTMAQLQTTLPTGNISWTQWFTSPQATFNLDYQIYTYNFATGATSNVSEGDLQYTPGLGFSTILGGYGLGGGPAGLVGPAIAPEPGTLAILGLGIATSLFRRRRCATSRG
jgi:hypothetical protein